MADSGKPFLDEDEPIAAAQSGTSVKNIPEPEGLRGRAYQYEMLEESMKRNIIIAAETGSGKTLIAILRIQAELERCPPEKLVWFCVPTVELATQQHRAIAAQLPAFEARVLSGVDNVDLWTEKWIWDEVLSGIRIVVSTHQVLLDALEHGFVVMKKLALMVFDEAHSCAGKHPSNRILHDFYHEAEPIERPAILGLTASPVINERDGNLGKLEANLNAIVRTPKLHRAEMLQYVHQPTPSKLIYRTNSLEIMISTSLQSLGSVYEALDIYQDPWVRKMLSNPDTRKSRALHKAMISHKTYCHDQIKRLYDKALAINSDLGALATDYYIDACIRKFERRVSEGSFVIEGFEDAERDYLRAKLSTVQIASQGANTSSESPLLAPKVRTLIEFLSLEEIKNFSGLIFVRTRAEVAVLSHILALHVPKYTIGTFVGASGFSGRKTVIAELADVKQQQHTLEDLRQGKNHIIVTTDALEEGIDVAACNVVICFDRPANLKSFIQRRGRARKSASKLVLMFEDGPSSSVVSTWQDFETEMREIYEDDMRVLEELEATEGHEDGKRELFNESTGAKLTLDDAVRHLYHFCAKLPATPYADLSPIFTFEEHFGPDRNDKLLSARVILPNSVDGSLREACSLCQWKTEKMAKRDAAFEAYAALYRAGLVNDHLLPLGHVDEGVDEAYKAVEKRPSLVQVSEQFDPWLYLAQEWQNVTVVPGSMVTVEHEHNIVTKMTMLLPRRLPRVADFGLYWDANTIFKASIAPLATTFGTDVIRSAGQSTRLLLQTIFSRTMGTGPLDFTAMFLPHGVANLLEWVEKYSGVIRGDRVSEDDMRDSTGLVRDLTQNRLPHVFLSLTCGSVDDIYPDGSMNIDQRGTTARLHINETNVTLSGDSRSGKKTKLGQDDNSRSCILIETAKLTKKVDFLHRIPERDAKIARTSTARMLLAERCELDRLPFRYSRFAMFIPSILHKVQTALIVDHLCKTILSPLQFKDQTLVEAAITSPSAQESIDYNRLEFLGDSILKFFTSLTLMAEHPNFHEGILSHKKDHIVSNGPLARAAIKTELDQFILTKKFTGLKWRPKYNSELLDNELPKQREMSSKTLADVIEALVGAAYLDGGPEMALSCLEVSLPDVPWSTALRANEILYNVYCLQVRTSTHLEKIEQILSYRFNLKILLVEALTHPSHHGLNGGASYQRLEFLGDSVLDNIVTTTAFAHEPPIATSVLHLIRSALVNGNFLGYLCLTLSTTLQRFDPVPGDSQNLSTVKKSYHFYLWQAMRHASPTVRDAQQSCLARLSDLNAEITQALVTGISYPWRLLARLEPPKFVSDIIESILGAIYIDTHGSLSHCQSFLEHLGLMPYLRRVMENHTNLLHPKEELGQLADREKVRYILGKDGEGDQRRLNCTIMVGEREVMTVGDGLSTMEVQTRAADEACNILRAEGKTARGGRWSRDGKELEEVEVEGEKKDVEEGGVESDGRGSYVGEGGKGLDKIKSNVEAGRVRLEGTEPDLDMVESESIERDSDDNDEYMSANE